jgi:hypothetical protein
MTEHSVAYVALDTSKLHNAVAIAEAGREGGGDPLPRGDRNQPRSHREAGTQVGSQVCPAELLL